MSSVPPIVSVDWLAANLELPNLVLLDATIKKAGSKEELQATRQLPLAKRFDIKKEFSNSEAPIPNTMLSPQEFQKKAQALGIDKTSFIVVYDQYGIYSSARAWWMFKAMGHHQVAVLNGGLPAWLAKNNPTVKAYVSPEKLGNFTARQSAAAFVDYATVYKAINGPETIVDARSAERFKAEVDEPRAGLRKGHIPNSRNLPYTQLLVNGRLKPKEELASFFTAEESYIFSCGSGVTACVLALAAEVVGHKDVSVYDGSWTEWGSLHELPIEV